MDLLFEWDQAKSAHNYLERGFGFDYAARIFSGPVLEEEDRRRNYAERRLIATGKADEEFLVIVYTGRASRRRTISAHPAKRSERDAYRKAFT